MTTISMDTDKLSQEKVVHVTDEETPSSSRQMEIEPAATCATNHHACSLNREMETEMEVDAVVLLEDPLKSDSSTSTCTKRDFWDTSSEQHVSDRVINIVIVGASGSGKSTAGNILLDRQYFRVSPKSSPFVSETKVAVTGENERKGIHLKVLDTPDIYSQDPKESSAMIEEWKTKIGSEPDLILLTIACSLTDPTGDVRRYKLFKRLWGDDSVCKRLALLFTLGDKLSNAEIEDLTRRLPPDLQKILQDAGGRYVVFDNTLDASEQEKRVDQVFRFLDEINKPNRAIEEKADHFHRVQISPYKDQVRFSRSPDRGIAKIPGRHHSYAHTSDDEDSGFTILDKHDEEMVIDPSLHEEDDGGFTVLDKARHGVDEIPDSLHPELQMTGNRHAVSFQSTRKAIKPEGHSLPRSCLPDDIRNSINVLIIGKTGNGKSTVGNVLLNADLFPVTSGMASSASGTETRTAQTYGFNINVTDTPDVANSDLNPKMAAEEIGRWKAFNPDVILLAVRCDVRYTPEEYQIYKQIKSVLTKRYICQRLIVAFTFGDREKNLEKELKNVCKELKKVLKDAGNRHCVFNEREEDKTRQENVLYLINFAQKRKVTVKSELHRQPQPKSLHSDAGEVRMMSEKFKPSEREHLQVSVVPDEPRDDVRVLIIGKTGNGKSTVGNFLLNKQAFSVSSGMTSSTTRIETQTAQIYGVNITVSDAPDVSNLDLDPKTAAAEIRTWTKLNPDVILLAVRCDVRYTPEEHQIYMEIRSVLGQQYICPRLTVAFTFGDRQEGDLAEELETVCRELKEVLQDAGHRYLVFGENSQEVHAKYILHLMTFVPNPKIDFELKRILLLGPPESGKSSGGNAITGRQVFNAGTETSKPISYIAEVGGRWLQVFDTPGIATGVGCLPLEQQLRQLLALTCPGPHGILFFIRESLAMPGNLKLIRKMHELNIQKYVEFVIFKDEERTQNVQTCDILEDILKTIKDINTNQPLWLLEGYSPSDRALMFKDHINQLFQKTKEDYLAVEKLRFASDGSEDSMHHNAKTKPAFKIPM